RHCQSCHALHGQNTGVPFGAKMDPPVADLSVKDVQDYTDGQLKWIIENGIKPSGMPGWKGILEDEEMWNIVHYIRHLPAKGSLGAPKIFKEEAEEHEHMHGAAAGSAAGVGSGVGDGVAAGGGFTGAVDRSVGALRGAGGGAVSVPTAWRTAAINASAVWGVATDPVRIVLKSIMRPYTSRVA